MARGADAFQDDLTHPSARSGFQHGGHDRRAAEEIHVADVVEIAARVDVAWLAGGRLPEAGEMGTETDREHGPLTWSGIAWPGTPAAARGCPRPPPGRAPA